ncbi:MAG: CHAT domain-containing protein, partial [Nitrospirota bacterium]|nr:CHAT domain-containing protein [Nitrospirota bacterium]
GKVYDRYEEAALFALAQGFNDRAFRYVESMKARTFLDQLTEGRIELEKGIDPDLKRKGDDIENALATVTNRISEEYRKTSPDEKALMYLRTEVERFSLELDRLKKQIRMKNPLYATIKYPDPVTVADLQTKVLSSDEVLLEFFVTSQGVYCFAVTTDSFGAVKLSGGKKDFYAKIESLLGNLESGAARGEGYDRASAGDLYDILLKPFEKIMAGKTLLVVPDGILTRLPFEALVIAKNGERSYLLEQHAVKYVQSASVLTMLRKQSSPAQTSNSFIGFGDPVYDYNSFKQGKPERDGTLSDRGISAGGDRSRYAGVGGRLGRLKASGDEVLGIERLFKAQKQDGQILLRDKASEESAKAAGMDQYGYVHFSMHGIVAPGLQAIVFSQIPGASEDGILTMGEIMNLRYNARLVVLSACQTGLGEEERGEGITGLTRAVMYAGSPAAVVSLWSVDDSGTHELMTRFYENMIQKKAGKSEALRRAKQEMIKTRYRHPFFWAAFVMYGE